MKNLTIKTTTQFKKDYKLAMRRGLKMQLLDDIIVQLSQRKTLPFKKIYRIDSDVLVLTLTLTGTHSDLLEK